MRVCRNQPTAPRRERESCCEWLWPSCPPDRCSWSGKFTKGQGGLVVRGYYRGLGVLVWSRRWTEPRIAAPGGGTAMRGGLRPRFAQGHNGQGPPQAIPALPSVPHRYSFLPAESDAAALPNTAAERVAAVNIHMLRQAEPGGERVGAPYGAAMHDAQALLLHRHVRLRGGAMRDGEVVDEHAIVLPVLERRGIAVLQPGIEDVVIGMANFRHLVRVEQAKGLGVGQFLDDRAGHAEMQPDAAAPGQRMDMHHRMHDARGGIDRRQPRPTLSCLLGQRVTRDTLMREMRAAAALGRADDVITGMREGGGDETAIVVPLRADIGDAVAAIIGQAKDMRIAIRRGGVDTVRAVQLAPAPPAACAQKRLMPDLGRVAKHHKATLRHFHFQRIQHLARRGCLGGKINAADLRADRLQRGNAAAERFDCGCAVRVERGEFRVITGQWAPPLSVQDIGDGPPSLKGSVRSAAGDARQGAPHSAAICRVSASSGVSRCTRQVQRSSEVKLAGSPCNSSTSACSFETKPGVLSPSLAAISSRMIQNDFSSRMLVLWPFRRMRRVSNV